jgi:hypothetical protein
MPDLYDRMREDGLVDPVIARAMVRSWIGKDCPFPNAAACARSIGVHPEQLRLFINGKRPAEPRLLAALGFERVVFYRPVNKTACNAENGAA